MKTNELIRQLRDADPKGNGDVCVGNVDIHFVSTEPAYWDGNQQVLIRNESQKNFYNIIGAKVVQGGEKIAIHTLSITEAIWNDSDIPIEYEDEERMTNTKEYHDNERLKVKKEDEEYEAEKINKGEKK